MPEDDEQRSDDMPAYPAQTFPSIRALWLIAIAAMTALSLWLLLPGGGSPWSADGNASLPPSLRVDGPVTSSSTNGVVTRLEVPLALRGSDSIHLTEGGRIHAVTYMDVTASAAIPATYTLSWLNSNGDDFLNPGERALLVVDLPGGSLLTAENPAKLVIKPIDAAPLTIEGVLP